MNNKPRQMVSPVWAQLGSFWKVGERSHGKGGFLNEHKALFIFYFIFFENFD